MEKVFSISVLCMALLFASCKDDDPVQNLNPSRPDDQMQLAISPENVILDGAKVDETALTFTWAAAHDRGEGTSIRYRFRLALANNAEKFIDIEDAHDREVTFTHSVLNVQLLEWNGNPEVAMDLKATVVAEVLGASVQMMPEVSEKTFSATPYGDKKSINGTELHLDNGDGTLYHADMDITKGQLLAVGGFAISNWWIDPDFFEKADEHTLKFLPITGKYRIIANFDRKFFKVEVMNGTQLATLQPDGSGAVWVLGSGIGDPLVKYGTVVWAPEKSYCLAPIGGGKYQLTGVVGERFKVNGTEFGLKFMLGNNWGAGEIRKPDYALTDFHAKYAPVVSDLFIVDEGDNIHLAYQGSLMNGGTYTFIIDASKGLDKVEITVKSLTEAPPTPDITINGTPMTQMDFDSFKAEVELIQGQPIVIGGTDAATLESYLIDPDFVDKSGAVPTLITVSGKYRVTASRKLHYVKLELMLGSSLATISTATGEGALWLLGNHIGKPSLATNETTFEPGNGFSMAPIGGKKHRISFVAGESISTSLMNMKFFGQNTWGLELAGEADLGQNKGKISTTSEYVKIEPGKGGGNIMLKDGTLLEEGKIYVFTVDLSSGFTNAILTVEKK